MRVRGISMKTWGECVREDMDLHGLRQEWAVNRDLQKDLILGKH